MLRSDCDLMVLFLAVTIGCCRIFQICAAAQGNEDIRQGFPENEITDEPFNRNCSNNESIPCIVTEGCPGDLVETNRSLVPSAPFNLHRRYVLIANPIRLPDPYYLVVNVSFEPPHDRSFDLVKGFELSFLKEPGGRSVCYTLTLINPKWNHWTRLKHMPLFTFHTTNLFEYGSAYHIEVQTLPKYRPVDSSVDGNETQQSAKSTVKNFVSINEHMPRHPEVPMPPGSYNCSQQGNPNAHAWTAAFRAVYTFPFNREIYVDFVAAPPQFCFEEYHLKLLIGERIIQMHSINDGDLRHEQYGNFTCAIGNVTFTDVEPGKYSIGIHPERYPRDTHSKVCYCPVSQSPNAICSCTMTTYPTVVLKAWSPMTTMSPTPQGPTAIYHDYSTWGLTLVVILLVILLGFVMVLLTYTVWKCRKQEAMKFLILPLRRYQNRDDNGQMLLDGDENPTHLLVVYSHDCEPHEKVVHKLVDLLTAELPGSMIVDVDFRCANEIAQNKHDWMYRTIKSADRIIVVHSFGGYMQYHARFASDANVAVERQRPGEFDDLFEYQLEMLADRMYDGKILHAYFDYTPALKLLPFAGAAQRYRLPQHLGELVANLKFVAAAANNGAGGGGYDPWAPPPSVATAERLANSRQLQELHDAVSAMRDFETKFPGWFEATHVKRPLQLPPVVFDERRLRGGSQPALHAHPVSYPDSHLDSHPDSQTVSSADASPALPKRKISNGEISTASAQSSSGIEDAGSSSAGGATTQGAFTGSSPSASERSLNEDVGATATQTDSGVYSLRNTGLLLTGDSSIANNTTSSVTVDEEKVRLIDGDDSGFCSRTVLPQGEKLMNHVKKYSLADGSSNGTKKKKQKKSKSAANRRPAENTGLVHQSNSNNVLIA